MASRAGLSFDRAGLTRNLKTSAARGMDAFFPSSPGPAPDAAKEPSSTPDAALEPTRDRPGRATTGRPPRGAPTSAAPARGPSTEPRGGARKSTADQSVDKDASRDMVQDAHSSREQRGMAETMHDTMVPRYHGVVTPGEVRRLRNAVKQVGKEAATYRFTREEKDQLSDVIHTCRRRGYRTSEVEITRIALNYLVGDYRSGGKRSVLHRVLRALRE